MLFSSMQHSLRYCVVGTVPDSCGLEDIYLHLVFDFVCVCVMVYYPNVMLFSYSGAHVCFIQIHG